MKLSKDNMMWIGIGILGLIIVYSNRASLFVNKGTLSADGGNGAIDKAISKLKSGQVKVNEMPEQVKQQLNNEV
jgi:hypothetical protein